MAHKRLQLSDELEWDFISIQTQHQTEIDSVKTQQEIFQREQQTHHFELDKHTAQLKRQERRQGEQQQELNEVKKEQQELRQQFLGQQLKELEEEQQELQELKTQQQEIQELKEEQQELKQQLQQQQQQVQRLQETVHSAVSIILSQQRQLQSPASAETRCRSHFDLSLDD